MNLRFNKGFSIFTTFSLLLIYSIGLIIAYQLSKIIYPYSDLEIPLITLLIANLTLIISNINGIIIGVWLFICSEKFKQDKWTWLLMGTVYEEFAVILIAIVVIQQNLNKQIDFLNSVQKILVLFIITFFLSISFNTLLSPYLSATLDTTNYLFVKEYTAYLKFLSYGIQIIMNLIIAVKFCSWIKAHKIQKSIWVIATVLLGLFPVLMFNFLTNVNKENNNVA